MGSFDSYVQAERSYFLGRAYEGRYQLGVVETSSTP
jgi:hypothetical protein